MIAAVVFSRAMPFRVVAGDGELALAALEEGLAGDELVGRHRAAEGGRVRLRGALELDPRLLQRSRLRGLPGQLVGELLLREGLGLLSQGANRLELEGKSLHGRGRLGEPNPSSTRRAAS